MHRSGHVGLGFLASVPLGLLAVEWGSPELAVAVSATVVGLSTLPDVDHSLPAVDHRTWTHSLPFAAVVGIVTGLLWGGVAGAIGAEAPLRLGLLGGTAGTLSVLTHMLGDVITPMGVALFWPVSGERRSLNLVASKQRSANVLLLAVGVVAWVATVGSDPMLVPAVFR